MPALTFSKWSSGGNTTLFLHDAGASPQEQAAWARAVLDPEVLGAEQAGTVSLAGRSLRMAGGEFCVNASRAFGALLALGSAPNGGEWGGEIRVSGWEGPVALAVRGAEPCWEVDARLQLPPTARPERHAGGIVVHLPGISHLLLPLDESARPQQGAPDLLSRARSTLSAAGLLAEAAAGVIWWQPTPEGARMMPVVHVRDAGTLMAEQACGSGALALALALAENGALERCRLHQPSGSVLEVRLEAPTPDGRITAEISGPVTLLARGRVWLDAADGAY
ncbi:MAG: hypothetical protein K2J64_05490 [Desulfovibrio sp.]|nr:hypothetical protein [Desulfovibrio sp.]